MNLAVVVLLVTTVFWSFLSARIHSSNADQLVNPFLFDSANTFKNSVFPSQHTYLLKWPLFFIIHLFNSSRNSFIAMTIVISLMTVILFAYFLYRIERRPLIFGTLLLALSSVLMLIPAQPYPGGLLPVNLAMITTRNLEYVLFISSLTLLVRAKQIKSKNFITASFFLTLLIASDKLFMSIGVGGSIVALLCYLVRRKWIFVRIVFRWLLLAIFSTLGAFLLLAILRVLNVTHFTASSVGPYGFITSFHQLELGVIYACIGILTNFGANPSYGTTLLKNIPSQSFHAIFGLSGPILIINLLILIICIVAAFRLFKLSFSIKAKKKQFDRYHAVSVLLLWTTIMSIGAFIATNHYYAVDARYESIALFALFTALATYIRGRTWHPQYLITVGTVIFLALALAVPNLLHAYNDSIKANTDINNRNVLIAEAVDSHRVNVLVGDYWRVIPIHQFSQDSVNVLPLSNCTTPRIDLSSSSWQADLSSSSFAYILSLDKSLTDYPKCELNTITNAYGRPNASVVISGDIDNPKELLLFYDHGAHKSSPNNGTTQQSSATIIPIALEDLANSTCTGPTDLNVVAHQDDDLLFMNPDLVANLQAGHCIRSVYLTAGDAGGNQFYWLGREQGTEAAYAKMIGQDEIWIHRTVKISDNRFITIANPKGNPKISLLFIRLPDGNIHGEGFKASNYESLQKLYNGKIESMQSVYEHSLYTKNDLIELLDRIMHTYQPTEIHTLSTYPGSANFTDHSDHVATSRLTKDAYDLYEKEQYNNAVTIPIEHYIGYPVSKLPANVSGTELENKVAIFLSYAKHDGAVCHNQEECHRTVYGIYLPRQYTSQ
jgi:LmbE family N-acetylglucosaminyl deacetylase